MKIYDAVFIAALILGITTLTPDGSTVRAFISGTVAGGYLIFRLFTTHMRKENRNDD